MPPDSGRRPGSIDELASLGLDSGPRRPAQTLDPGEGRLRGSVPPVVSHRVILSIELVQNTGQASFAASRWKIPMVHCEGRLEPVDDFVFTTAARF
jgi:hypothetical protein